MLHLTFTAFLHSSSVNASFWLGSWWFKLLICLNSLENVADMGNKKFCGSRQEWDLANSPTHTSAKR